MCELVSAVQSRFRSMFRGWLLQSICTNRFAVRHKCISDLLSRYGEWFYSTIRRNYYRCEKCRPQVYSKSSRNNHRHNIILVEHGASLDELDATVEALLLLVVGDSEQASAFPFGSKP